MADSTGLSMGEQYTNNMDRLKEDFPGGSVVKNMSAKQKMWVQSLGWEYPLEKEMATHSSTLPGKFHGRRRLVGNSQWDLKK